MLFWGIQLLINNTFSVVKRISRFCSDCSAGSCSGCSADSCSGYPAVFCSAHFYGSSADCYSG